MKHRFGKLVNLDMRRIRPKFIKNTVKRRKQERRKIAKERERGKGERESINDGSTKKVPLFQLNIIISDTSVLGSSERCSRNVHSSVELILSVGGSSASILMHRVEFSMEENGTVHYTVSDSDVYLSICNIDRP